MPEPCAHCPAVPLGLTCPRWPSNHRRYCEWVDPDHPGYLKDGAAALVGMAQKAAGMEPKPAPVPASLPGPFRKVANFGKAIIQHAVAGLPEADDAAVQNRMQICRSCDQFDAERTACNVCGCHLDIKIRWAEQRCPIGRW